MGWTGTRASSNSRDMFRPSTPAASLTPSGASIFLPPAQPYSSQDRLPGPGAEYGPARDPNWTSNSSAAGCAGTESRWCSRVSLERMHQIDTAGAVPPRGSQSLRRSGDPHCIASLSEPDCGYHGRVARKVRAAWLCCGAGQRTVSRCSTRASAIERAGAQSAASGDLCAGRLRAHNQRFADPPGAQGGAQTPRTVESVNCAG